MIYQPPFVYGATPAVPGIFNADADASYINGDPSTGTEGSYFPNAGIEHPQREIMAALASAGVTGDVAVLDQLAESMAVLASKGVAATCTGTANTYTLTKLTNVIVSRKLFTKMLVRTKINVTNTGATTANVFEIGSRKVLNYDGTELAAGALVAGKPTVWEFDLTADGGAGAWLVLPWAIPTSTTIADDIAKLKSPAYFIATSSGQSIGNSSWTKLTNWTATPRFFDGTSSFSAGTLTVRGADAGVWLFQAQVVGPGNCSAAAEIIKVNRIGYDQTYSNLAGLATGISCFAMRYMLDGESAEVNIWQNSGSVYTTAATTGFTAMRVSD